MNAERDRNPPRYRFGPLERRGLVAGWRGGQIAVVAAALLLAVLGLRSLPTAGGLAVAIGLVAVAIALATWPVAGRTVEEWAPDGVRFLVGRRRPTRRDPLSVFSTLSMLAPTATGAAGAPAAVGVIHDRLARTFTTVLPASGTGFVLLGPEDKAARVEAWGRALASLARQGGLVHRLQWVERSLPDGGAEVLHYFAERGAMGADAAAGRSYAALLESEPVVAQRHEVLLALTVHAASSARAVRAAGGGLAGACTVLLRQAASLRRQMGEAGIDVGPPLDPASLGSAIHRGFEPDGSLQARARMSGGTSWRPAATPGTAGAPLVSPWPMALESEWGRVRVDGTWHATFWVAEWPRTDVGPDFLAPLLLAGDLRRTVSVVMEPVSPLRAARRVEQARTADIADAELRGRGGFLSTARRRREEEVLVEREDELADGHGHFRYTGYVTVSAGDLSELDDACIQAELAAARSGLELRRCYGDQARAFACSLPLGRGLV
jgi:Putative type VII ESX secretion system translocon, EccE